MERQPFCSIIVLNFNGRMFLGDCFNSLANISYPKNRYEVIMVDNGSNDDSVKFVKSRYPWVKILRLDKNYGFSEGNNKGLGKAKGTYIVFLNNDTKVEECWLSGLVKVANKDGRIGICGSKVIDQKLGVVGEGYLNALGGLEIRGRHEIDKECFWVSGASMLVKREVLDKLGCCFDSDYFAYFEDVDLCWRARLFGYKVYYAPGSKVLHKGGGASSKKYKGKNVLKFYHYRNKIWTFKKNLRFPLAQIFLMPIFVETLFTILYRSIRGQWGHGPQVLNYIFSKKEKTPGLNLIPLKEQLKIFNVR